MGSFRWARFAATPLIAALAVLLVPAAVGAQTPVRRVVIAVLPESEARTLFAGHRAVLGLGVFPEDRDPRAFLEEIGYGAPHGGSISTGDSKPVRVADAISDAGLSIAWTTRVSAMVEPLRAAFPQTRGERGFPANAALTIHFVNRASDLAETIRVIPRGTGFVVFGVGEDTPVLTGICRSPCGPPSRPGLLAGGIARRPGIVTPYDVGATLMDMLGVARRDDVYIGRPLRTESSDNPLGSVEAMEERIVRDASVGSTAAVVTDAITVAVLFFGVFLVAAGRAPIAARGAQGGWTAVTVGYPASLFLSGGNGTIRAIPVVVAAMLGAALPPQRSVRTARVFFGVAVATAILFAVAPLNPGGEPGLSIWGNPLTSWRFFGMQNAWAATIAGGIVVWGVLAGLGVTALVAVATLAALVIGTPTIGANFVGVLTFTFGAALAALALSRRKVEPVQVVIAGATALVAFLLALLADVGSPVSHGGRAAKRISDGGISTAWDFVTGRIRLNIDLIRGFWGGVLWVAVMLVALALMMAWGARVAEGPERARVAVWAGASMALASLVLEDSGFFSGMTLLGAALAAWIVTAAGLSRPRNEPAPAPGAG